MATPLTDRWIQPGPGHDCVTGEDIPVVHADDCRRLEESHARLLRAAQACELMLGNYLTDDAPTRVQARAAIAVALEIK